jgi:cytidyltransferase-like protein
MKKIAVFPGSFDPFTIGHEAIIRRAMDLFDEIIIAVGANALKKNYYPLQDDFMEFFPQLIDYVEKDFGIEISHRITIPF